MPTGGDRPKRGARNLTTHTVALRTSDYGF